MKYGWKLVGNILVHYIDIRVEHNYKCPAVIYDNGTKYWYQNEKLHRIDGPASEYSYLKIKKYWYYQGKEIKCKSQQEFERIIKLKLLW